MRNKLLLTFFIFGALMFFGAGTNHADAAIAVNATSSARATAATLSWTHTTGVLTNGILVVGISIQDSNHANYWLYNTSYSSSTAGVNRDFTLARTDEATGNNKTLVYYLVNPNPGTYTITFTLPASLGEIAGSAISFSGVDQENPLDAVSGGSGSSATPTTTIVTSVANTYTFSVVSAEATISTIGNSQTAVSAPLTDQSFENSQAAYKSQGAAANNNLSYTLSSGQSWAISALALAPDGATLGAIQVEYSTSTKVRATVTSLTFAYNVTSTANTILVLSIASRQSGASTTLAVSTSTYNGQALTKLRADLWNVSSFRQTEIWYLVAPPTGNNNLSVTWAGSNPQVVVSATTFTGVDQNTPFEVNAGSGSNAVTNTSSTVSITTLTNNALIFSSTLTKDSILTSSTINHIFLSYNEDSASAINHFAGTKRTGNAGAYNINIAWKNNNGWAISLGALKPAAAAAAGEPPDFRILLNMGQIILQRGNIILKP